MTENPSDPKRKLLDEVLSSESYHEFDANLRRKALATFRRGLLVRKIISNSVLGTVVLGAIGLVFFITSLLVHRDQGRALTEQENPFPAGADFTRHPLNRETHLAPMESATTEADPNVSPRASEPKGARNLTDEELIASFPPNTCLLAEVEGRKILVFRDATLRKQYLH